MKFHNFVGKKVMKFRSFKENEFVEFHNLRDLSCDSPQLNQKNILRMSKTYGAKVLGQAHQTSKGKKLRDSIIRRRKELWICMRKTEFWLNPSDPIYKKTTLQILQMKFHSIKLKFHSSLNQKLTMLIRVKSILLVRVKIFSRCLDSTRLLLGSSSGNYYTVIF